MRFKGLGFMGLLLYPNLTIEIKIPLIKKKHFPSIYWGGPSLIIGGRD